MMELAQKATRTGRTSKHKNSTFCNFCKKDINFSRVKILEKEGWIKRKGKKERCKVIYFRCPHCDKKYLISVKAHSLDRLEGQVKVILQEFPRTNMFAFNKALDAAKNALVIEQKTLNYIYKKQHPHEGMI